MSDYVKTYPFRKARRNQDSYIATFLKEFKGYSLRKISKHLKCSTDKVRDLLRESL